MRYVKRNVNGYGHMGMTKSAKERFLLKSVEHLIEKYSFLSNNSGKEASLN